MSRRGRCAGPSAERSDDPPLIAGLTPWWPPEDHPAYLPATPYPYRPSAPPRRSTRNWLALAALAFALMGVPLLLVDASRPLAFLLGLVAAGLAIPAGVRVAAGRSGGKTLSIAGTALGSLVAVLAIAAYGSSGAIATAIGSSLRVTTPPGPGTVQLQYGDGTFLVGYDIDPGVYHSAGPLRDRRPNCYWERSSADAGDVGSIIANDNSPGPVTITINRSDRSFKSHGCLPWVRVR
jgi:hypothetical protein